MAPERGSLQELLGKHVIFRELLTGGDFDVLSENVLVQPHQAQSVVAQ